MSDSGVEDGVSAMRNRRARNKRGALPSRHADTKTGDGPPAQMPDAPAAEPVPDSIDARVSAGGNAGGPGVDEPVDQVVEPVEPVAAHAAAAAGESAGVSASGNAGTNAGTQAGNEADGIPGAAAGEPAGVRVEPDGGAARSKRAPRRAGRPRGPERVPLSVRILAHLDERLTEEVERQEINPQSIVDQALAEYFTRLDRARHRTAGISAGGNDSENDSGNAG